MCSSYSCIWIEVYNWVTKKISLSVSLFLSLSLNSSNLGIASDSVTGREKFECQTPHADFWTGSGLPFPYQRRISMKHPSIFFLFFFFLPSFSPVEMLLEKHSRSYVNVTILFSFNYINVLDNWM